MEASSPLLASHTSTPVSVEREEGRFSTTHQSAKRRVIAMDNSAILGDKVITVCDGDRYFTYNSGDSTTKFYKNIIISRGMLVLQKGDPDDLLKVTIGTLILIEGSIKAEEGIELDIKKQVQLSGQDRAVQDLVLKALLDTVDSAASDIPRQSPKVKPGEVQSPLRVPPFPRPTQPMVTRAQTLKTLTTVQEDSATNTPVSPFHSISSAFPCFSALSHESPGGRESSELAEELAACFTLENSGGKGSQG